MPRSNNTCNSRPELWFNVALALITLISSAHAGEQKASAQTDTATPIENPPLPRPKPSLHDVTGNTPAILISAFRHQHGEESVAISPVLTRIAQEQANAMAARDSLDHNALAPFSSRIGRSGFSRAAENIAYGHADFAGTLVRLCIAPICCCTGRSGSASHTHKMAAESIGQWSLREDKNSVAASACGCPLSGVVGSGVWTRQRNQRLETGFASQKIALGSKWEADSEVCACAYVPRRFPPPWSVEELDACFIQSGRVKTVR